MKWRISSPQKLAPFLAQELSESAKAVRRALEKNVCRVNGRIERFGSFLLAKGDFVELSEGWKGDRKEKLVPKILFEAEDFQIVDKPMGWVCEPSNVPSLYGKGLLLVHRLDKDTTGALLLAKSKRSADELMELFAKREVKKEYLALVDGIARDGRRESYLAKKKEMTWGSAARGALAITDWKVVAKGDRASLLSCEPLTGRTHQIRVHLAESGHPILIDRDYAERFLSPLYARRPLLHARRLGFLYRGERVEAISPLPQDMQDALNGVSIACAFSS